MKTVNNEYRVKSYILMFFGLLTIVVGLPYVVGIYGETQVTFWAWISIIGGLLIVVFSKIRMLNIVNTLLVFVFSLLLTSQSVPASYWIVFYAKKNSGLEVPMGVTYHWAFAIPHVIIFVFGIIGMLQLKKISFSKD